MSMNPYQAPKAAVADFVDTPGPDGLLDRPRRRPPARGASWFGESWQLFRPEAGLWVGIWVVMVLILMAAGFVPVLGMFAQSIGMLLLGAGIVAGCEALRRGEALQFAHLFAGFSKNTTQLLVAGLLYGVASLGAFLIAFIPTLGLAGGLGLFSGDAAAFEGQTIGLVFAIWMLLFLALVIPLMMLIWFAPALILLHDKPALEAMRLSFVACLRNIVPFLVYGLIGMLLAIVATIPLALGWLVLGPLISISAYASYRDIFFAD